MMRSEKFIQVATESRESPKAHDTTGAANSPPGMAYALDNAAAQAGDRFVALSAIFDTAMHRVLTQRGADLRFGRLLFARLRAPGLDNVGAEAREFMLPGRSVGARLLRTNFDQLREAMIEGGHITAEEFEHDIRRLDDPNF